MFYNYLYSFYKFLINIKTFFLIKFPNFKHNLCFQTFLTSNSLNAASLVAKFINNLAYSYTIFLCKCNKRAFQIDDNKSSKRQAVLALSLTPKHFMLHPIKLSQCKLQGKELCEARHVASYRTFAMMSCHFR